jgi:Ca2+-binding RTX toxin-like protein
MAARPRSRTSARIASGLLIVIAAGALSSITLAGAGDGPTIASYYYYYNTPPVAVNDSYATDEDTPLTVPAPGVLGNDSDDEGDPLTAVLVTGPAHESSFALNPNGSFSYTPEPNFFGTDTFTYRASDGAELSNVATVTITVNPVNDPPTVAVNGGACLQGAMAVATLNLTVADPDDPAGSLVLSATSSNQALIPNGNLVVGGSGANRTLTLTALLGKFGTAVITITVSDGTAETDLDVTSLVGGPGFDTLTGTSGPDVLFGQGGNDTLTGDAGIDVLCGGVARDTLLGNGGNDALHGGPGHDILRGGDGDDKMFGEDGNDSLTGNLGADFFSGGPGMDVNTDVTPAQGDTTDGT